MEVNTHSQSQWKYLVKSVLYCTAFTLLLVGLSFAKGFVSPDFERLAHGTLGLVAALIATSLFLKTDKKQFADIGLSFQRKTIPNFLIGVIAGICLMGLLAASSLYLSNVEVEVNPKSNFFHFIFMTLPLLPLALMEELGFRAYPLEILKDRVGIRYALAITSILFAVYHIANGWTVASSFYGPGIWGLLFGLAAIYSKGIAMPTGIHYAANLTTSAFGTATGTVNLWIVKESEQALPIVPTGIDWATILPAATLLFLAIIGIELYIRKNR